MGCGCHVTPLESDFDVTPSALSHKWLMGVTSHSQEAADFLNNAVQPAGEGLSFQQWVEMFGSNPEKRADEWQRVHVLMRMLKHIRVAEDHRNVPVSTLKQVGHGSTGLGTQDTASAWAEQLPAANAHLVAVREADIANRQSAEAEAERQRARDAHQNAASVLAARAKQLEQEWRVDDELPTLSPTDADFVAGVKEAMRSTGLLLTAASGGGLGDVCRSVDGDGWEMMRRGPATTRFERNGALRGRIAGVDALEYVPPPAKSEVTFK